MSDSSSSIRVSGDGRKFSWMPVLDGYIFRSFMVPFGILLFAFTLLFIIMDMYNEIGDFLDNKAPISVAVKFFTLKIPGNIRFILPITVLLACMYALANLGRNRELTAIRASGISLVRCGMPIFTVGFCVMLVNFYFNEYLVPETTRDAEIVKKQLENPNYVEQTNARLQFHSGDRLRSWYFGQFDDDGYQEKVKLKMFETIDVVKKHLPESVRSNKIESDDKNKILHVIEAKKTFYDDKNSAWVFFKPVIGRTSYSYKKTENKDTISIVYKEALNDISTKNFARYYDLKADTQFIDFPRIFEDTSLLGSKDAAKWLAENYSGGPEDEKILTKGLAHIAKTLTKSNKNQDQDVAIPEHLPSDEKECRAVLESILKDFPSEKIDNLLGTVEFDDVVRSFRDKLDLSQNDLDILAFYDNEAKDAYSEMDGQSDELQLFQEFQKRSTKDRDELKWEKSRDPVLLVVSDRFIPDRPSVIIKSVIEPDALSSWEIFLILRDNPNMAKSLRHIYATILFNRLAFPWACFLCAFFALPLATKNERSGIFTAIATAVGIAVIYQVMNEIFMVAGKNGYLTIDALEDFLHFPLGPFLAGIAPTILFGGYGIYLLKKVG